MAAPKINPSKSHGSGGCTKGPGSKAKDKTEAVVPPKKGNRPDPFSGRK